MKKAKKIRVLSYAATKRKLDEEFQAMIRARDSDRRCISCGERPVENAGHFIKRKPLATRWDVRNVHGQCIFCNKFQDGNLFQYGMAIKRKCGESVPEMLTELSRREIRLKAYELQALRDAVKAGYDDYVVAYERMIAPKLAVREG